MLKSLWNKIAQSESEELSIFSPVDGKVIPLSEVPDPVFSGKMLGDGVAVVPTDGTFFAPFSGKIVTLFPTGHAIGLQAENGAEILIHIGLDTVELGAAAFQIHVRPDQEVKLGELLITADLAAISAAGKSPITPIVLTNTPTEWSLTPAAADVVQASKDLLYTVQKI